MDIEALLGQYDEDIATAADDVAKGYAERGGRTPYNPDLYDDELIDPLIDAKREHLSGVATLIAALIRHDRLMDAWGLVSGDVSRDLYKAAVERLS